VLLFVKLAPGFTWSEELSKQVKNRIRSELTPRHVPALVIPVQDIPYTRSGKKVEVAVTRIIHGQEVSNKDALVNPEALTEYEVLRDRLAQS
jgi:acetoacetyl-CoA synthetase